MAEFNLKDAPAKIRPNASIVSSGTHSRGGAAVKTADTKLIVEVDINNTAKGVEFLFPGLDLYLKDVASIENYKGEDRSSRTSLPEMNVNLVYGKGSFLKQGNCPIKGKPQVKIKKDGSAVLVLRILAKLSPEELALVAGHIESDIRISLEPSQLDIEAPVTDIKTAKKSA